MPIRKSRKKNCKTVYKQKSKSRQKCTYVKIKICHSPNKLRVSKKKSRRKRKSPRRSRVSKKKSRSRKLRRRSRVNKKKSRSRKLPRRSRVSKKKSRRKRKSPRRVRGIKKKSRSRKNRSKKGVLQYNFNTGFTYSMNRKKKSICQDVGCKLCQNTFVIHPLFIKNVIPKLKHHDEISGSLKIKNQQNQIINLVTGENVLNEYECTSGCDNIFQISNSQITSGNGESAEMIVKRAGYHTHPEVAYLNHNCSLGWPSKDDYITFLETFLGYNTVLHIVVAIEGFYIITIPYKTIKTLESFSNYDAKDLLLNAVKKYINIDKNGYSMQNGYRKNNININDPTSYQKFINNIRLPKDKDVPSKLVGLQPFRIDFLYYKDMGVKMYRVSNSKLEAYNKYGCPYNPDTNEVEIVKKNTVGVKFSYPSINNNCHLNDL